MITSHDHYGRETGLHILRDVLHLELAQYRILQGRCYDFFNRHHKCRVWVTKRVFWIINWVLKLSCWSFPSLPSSPCSPCSPNLLRVLTSGMAGWHNLSWEQQKLNGNTLFIQFVKLVFIFMTGSVLGNREPNQNVLVHCLANQNCIHLFLELFSKIMFKITKLHVAQ